MTEQYGIEAAAKAAYDAFISGKLFSVSGNFPAYTDLSDDEKSLWRAVARHAIRAFQHARKVK